jgi:hypothetical protein
MSRSRVFCLPILLGKGAVALCCTNLQSDHEAQVPVPVDRQAPSRSRCHPRGHGDQGRLGHSFSATNPPLDPLTLGLER